MNGDRGGVGLICTAGGSCKAEDVAIEEWNEELGVEAAEESKGVHSEGGGSPLLVLASRLHTGQNVLQVVSQESTQIAWNLWKQGKILSFSPKL